jgi:hypothetical protein
MALVLGGYKLNRSDHSEWSDRFLRWRANFKLNYGFFSAVGCCSNNWKN